MSRVDPQTIAVYPKSTPDPKDSECPTKLPYDNHTGALNLDCFRFPEYTTRGLALVKKVVEPSVGTSGAFVKSKRKYEGENPNPTAYAMSVDDKNSRNRLAEILLKQSDDICTLELGRLVADEATVNASLNVLTSGFTAAAAIVTG